MVVAAGHCPALFAEFISRAVGNRPNSSVNFLNATISLRGYRPDGRNGQNRLFGEDRPGPTPSATTFLMTLSQVSPTFWQSETNVSASPTIAVAHDNSRHRERRFCLARTAMRIRHLAVIKAGVAVVLDINERTTVAFHSMTTIIQFLKTISISGIQEFVP